MRTSISYDHIVSERKGCTTENAGQQNCRNIIRASCSGSAKQINGTLRTISIQRKKALSSDIHHAQRPGFNLSKIMYPHISPELDARDSCHQHLLCNAALNHDTSLTNRNDHWAVAVVQNIHLDAREYPHGLQPISGPPTCGHTNDKSGLPGRN